MMNYTKLAIDDIRKNPLSEHILALEIALNQFKEEDMYTWEAMERNKDILVNVNPDNKKLSEHNTMFEEIYKLIFYAFNNNGAIALVNGYKEKTGEYDNIYDAVMDLAHDYHTHLTSIATKGEYKGQYRIQYYLDKPVAEWMPLLVFSVKNYLRDLLKTLKKNPVTSWELPVYGVLDDSEDALMLQDTLQDSFVLDVSALKRDSENKLFQYLLKDKKLSDLEKALLLEISESGRVGATAFAKSWRDGSYRPDDISHIVDRLKRKLAKDTIVKDHWNSKNTDRLD